MQARTRQLFAGACVLTLIGAMAVFGLQPEKNFRSDQVALAEGIAHLAAIAVQNARLFEEVRWRAEESQALIRTARSVTASLDLVTVLITQQALFQAQDVLAQAQLSRLQAVVSLFQALGGGWQKPAKDGPRGR